MFLTQTLGARGVLVKDAAKRRMPDGLPFPAALRGTPPVASGEGESPESEADQ